MVVFGFCWISAVDVAYYSVSLCEEKSTPRNVKSLCVCVCVSACFCVRESFGRGLFSEIVAPIADESCKVSKSHRGWRVGSSLTGCAYIVCRDERWFCAISFALSSLSGVGWLVEVIYSLASNCNMNVRLCSSLKYCRRNCALEVEWGRSSFASTWLVSLLSKRLTAFFTEWKKRTL